MQDLVPLDLRNRLENLVTLGIQKATHANHWSWYEANRERVTRTRLAALITTEAGLTSERERALYGPFAIDPHHKMWAGMGGGAGIEGLPMQEPERQPQLIIDDYPDGSKVEVSTSDGVGVPLIDVPEAVRRIEEDPAVKREWWPKPDPVIERQPQPLPETAIAMKQR